MVNSLELGRFRKRIWELETRSDKWVYLLKHMHELAEIPKEFSDPLFTRLFMLAEIDNFTAEEYQQYIESLGNMGDYQNIINTAVEEAELRGRAIGREEGRTEGREEGKLYKAVEIASRMLSAGMAKGEVAGLVGLTEEELDAAIQKD